MLGAWGGEGEAGEASEEVGGVGKGRRGDGERLSPAISRAVFGRYVSYWKCTS